MFSPVSRPLCSRRSPDRARFLTARSPSTCAQTEGQYLRKARHRARKGIGSTLNPIPKCPLRASNPPSRNLIQQRIVLAGFRHICRGNPIVVTHLLMCVVGTFPGRHRGLPLRPISAIIFPDAVVVVGQVAHFNLTPEASLCRGFYLLPFVLSGSTEEPDLHTSSLNAQS